MDKLKTLLKDERKSTDESLVAERDKTNQSLLRSRAKAENQIDKSVSEGRLEADQAMEAARTKADSRNDKRQVAADPKVEDEKRNSEAQIAIERAQSDSAVELERSQVDAALEKERELKSDLAIRILEQERKLTDRNLSYERTQSDLEVLRSSSLLSDERSEHSKTKISLTTRNEFLAIVSHDLRNPIGAAASCAEMLLEDATFANIDPEVKHWIEFIKRNVDVSLRMIADLLDLERMALGKLKLNLEKIRVGQIIRQSVESFAHAASAKGVLLRAIPIIGSDEAVCDFDRILQVLSNLIGNALKFTPEGGTITVSASIIDTAVQVSIEDTGPGIPEEKLGQIFERFAQLGSNDRRGLGLGLYISKMLIDAHGGRIWVKSKINEGSTLFFTIPNSSSSADESIH